jgi:hypothetical protein
VDVDLREGAANIVPIGDDERQLADCAEVRSPPTEHPDLVLIFP